MADTNFMFDELDKNIPTPPPAPGSGVRPPVSAKAEDIFSEVDKTVKPEALRPRADNPLSAPSTVIPPDDSWLKNKGLIAGFIFGGLIIIIGGGFLGFKLMNKSKAPVNTDVKNEAANKIITPEAQTPVAEEEVEDTVELPIQPTVIQPVDSDQDGLTDEEEAALGTNPNNPDTDQDGLTDREEAKVYGTDPLIADTDGDGYPDGQEVKNGFNPKGPGKLLDINNQ